MKNINIDELRKIQLDILDDIAMFCEENKLTYFLSYGTLLGAIRHNGYIPWDDDIDIAMPRPDYECFLKKFNHRESVYKVIHYSNNKSYNLPFAKVHDTRTAMWEYMYKKEDFGVYVDIFPLDGSPKHGCFRFINYYLNMFLNTKKAILDDSRPMSKNYMMRIGKILLYPISSGVICSLMDKIGSIYDYEKSPKVGLTILNVKEEIDKSLLEKTLYHSFEDRSYRIPEGYEGYLKELYGDYMKLPPKEKQVTHHTFKAWWK